MALTKRFRRRPYAPPIRLTPRDIDILRQVERNRFIDSRQIIALAPGSPQQILRRLQGLYHAGYLNRPRSQVRYFSEEGPRPIIYELGRAGKRLVADPARPRRIDIKEVKQPYLEHALLVSEVMLAFARSGSQAGAPSVLSGEDIGGKLPPPFKWSVMVRHADSMHRIGICPDKTLAADTSKQRVLLFVEADRGTMPIMRRSLWHSSFFRKLLAYEATWTQGLAEKNHGIARFRVLTVTTSAARAKNLAQSCAQLTRGRGLFLFTDIESLKKSPDIFKHTWLAGHGGESRIF